ncbi:MAG TPA: DapH/DapD/GlmU-related protein [Pyrinomonadaceae bacterium]|nr:DapH/DapD/GlmU-related protein [Pyrinomonadaceae bacterium]
MKRRYQSHGSGQFELDEFRSIGDNVIFEHGVLVFHPEAIEIGDNVYVGHNSILKGYYKNFLRIGNNTWIGQNCFFHSAGGISIGNNVGIAPHVKILTSYHKEGGREVPILFSELEFSEVVINDDCDIGIGSILMPGVTIGTGAQIGAGAVVTTNIPDYSVAVGVPAKVVRTRK